MDDKTRISPEIGAIVVGPGTQLSGIFELEERIAIGGMGEVYRGHNIETGDRVAIKIVLPEFARDQTILALFRKEASILNHLSHDAIVRYHVFTVDPRIGRPYLAMEFVDGDSLFDIIERGPMPTADVRHLCHRLALGLTAVHEAGAIHRDLSPDNIILPGGRVDRAKIIDFGIARSTHAGGETLIGGKFAGKYNFVSPEQLGLNGGMVSDKSDIYSLGLVLAAALRGKPLEMSGSQLEIIEKRRAVPDLLQIDPVFRPIVEAMLQPDPLDRPTSAELAMMTSVNAFEADVASNKDDDGGRKPAAGVKDAGGNGRFVAHKAPAYLPKQRRVPVAVAKISAVQKRGGYGSTMVAAAAVLAILGGGAAYMTGVVSFGTPGSEGVLEQPVAVLTPVPDGAPPPESAARPPADTPEPTAVPAEPMAGPSEPSAAPAPQAGASDPTTPRTEATTPAVGLGEPASQQAAPTDETPADEAEAAGPADDLEPPQTEASESPETPTETPSTGEVVEAEEPAAEGAPSVAETKPAPRLLEQLVEPPVTNADPSPAELQSDEQVAIAPRAEPPLTVDLAAAAKWIAVYQGGNCFYASPVVLEPQGVAIEGLATAAAPFELMATAFEAAFNVKPTMRVQLIDPAQCAVTDFLKATSGRVGESPTLTLEHATVSEGVPLAGVLRTAGDPGISFYLVDHKGMVFNLTERVDARSGEAAFRIPIGLGSTDKAAGRVVPQLLLAVTGVGGVEAASFIRPTAAENLFPRIIEEAESEDKTLSSVARYFRLGQ